MYSLAQATLVGAMAAAPANTDDSYLELARGLLDAVISQGRPMKFADSASQRGHLGRAGPGIPVRLSHSR